MKASNWIQQADQAMLRAATRAKALAADTQTPIHILKNGKIVEIIPLNEDRQSTHVKLPDEPGLSVVREDAPPYGNQKP